MIKVQTTNKIAETSSKGNQEKWFNNNRWYKLDNFGYEALSETVTSSLIEQTNIKDLAFTHVSYRMEKLEVHNNQRTGCSSENFLKPNQSLITLAKLFRQCIGPNWQAKANKRNSIESRIKWIIEQTKELTKLERFDEYLTLIFELDMLFCNEDRHLNNIAVIQENNAFKYCPFFDFGAGLLSNIRDYPLDILPSTLLKQLKANPLNTSFNRQVHAIEKLTGPKLEIHFKEEKIMQALEPALEYYPKLYIPYIKDRVLTTIKTQSKKLS
jgi:hypothetical protein